MKLRESLIKFSSSGCGVHLTVIDVPSTKSKVILGGGMLLPERNKCSTIHQFVGKGDSAYLDLYMLSEITASFFMRSITIEWVMCRWFLYSLQTAVILGTSKYFYLQKSTLSPEYA